VAVRAKEFTYAVELARTGTLTADGEAPLDPAAAWSPDHLLLAAVVRCTLKALGHHGKRAGIEVDAAATASGRVTRRESDGRYAFVEIECRFDVWLQPDPAPEQLAELIARAERDCFVGASLTIEPRYHWLVNGVDSTPRRSS
jgi:uncharacterized OsmC-like protein